MHWYNAPLKKRIPGPLLNQPGTGCFIQKKAKAPGASTLFWLRYDEQEHLRRHRSLRHWAIACPCCSHPQDYSNVHALFHCTADRIPRASKQDYEEARTHLKAYWDSFFIEGLPEAPSEAPSGALTETQYLQWLTGPHPTHYKDASRRAVVSLTQTEIDRIAIASATFHTIRRKQQFTVTAQRPPPTAAPRPRRRRPTDADKVLIVQRIYQCRDAHELESVLRWTSFDCASLYQAPQMARRLPRPIRCSLSALSYTNLTGYFLLLLIPLRKDRVHFVRHPLPRSNPDKQ